MDSRLILYVNKLHHLTSQFRGGPLMALPQIAVVGDQSAGKSSLLQNFIGKDFLPAGNDKVTRRPIMLQLIHVDKDEAARAGPLEYAIFPDESPEKKYTDFNQVKQKLHAYMNEVSKADVVSDQTVTMEIYSPNVVTLTLFDLPGLVANNVQDEPADAPDKIRALVKKHIQEDNVIILAVVAGNTDVAVSNAVRLAEEVDPKGDRTVLAVTMLDVVNDEDAKDKSVNLLMGKIRSYKEGIVGVINKRPEITTKKTIQELRAEEVKILQDKFQPLAAQKGSGTLRMGSEYLQQLLSKLLVRRISEYLSDDLHRRIDQRMEEYNAVLKMYGDGSNEIDQDEILEEAIVVFTRLFSDTVTGQAKDLTMIEPLIERSNYKILFLDFPKELQVLKNAPIFNDDRIRENIMIALGCQPQLSAPFNAFQSMVRQYIDLTRAPCWSAACDVKNGLSYTVEKCGNAMPGPIARFPVLLSVIIQRTLDFLSKRLEEAQDKLKTEIDMEWEYININHPDFDKVCDDPSLQPKANTASAVPMANDEKAYESRRINELLTDDPKQFKMAMQAYIDIIYRNTLAMVPKVIYFTMINEAKEKLQGHLRSYLRKNLEDRLFDEPSDIVDKRMDAQNGIRECEEAKVVLAEMRQYSSRREG